MFLNAVKFGKTNASYRVTLQESWSLFCLHAQRPPRVGPTNCGLVSFPQVLGVGWHSLGPWFSRIGTAGIPRFD